MAGFPAFHEAARTNPGRTSVIRADFPLTRTWVFLSYGTDDGVPSRSLTETAESETDCTTPWTLTVPELWVGKGAGVVVVGLLPEDGLCDGAPWLASAGAANPSASAAIPAGAARRTTLGKLISSIIPARDYRTILHL